VYYGLDAVGTDIWRLLGQGNSEQQIVEHLLEEYEVEPRRLAADVSAFVAELRRHELVEPAAD
jgi:hypothetical protein